MFATRWRLHCARRVDGTRTSVGPTTNVETISRVQSPLDTGARDAVFVCPLRAFRVWSLLVSFDALGEMLAALLQAVGTDLALQLTQEEAHDGEGVPDVCLAQARVELDHRAVYLPAHLQLEDLCQGQ